jgi:hypothetical protein
LPRDKSFGASPLPGEVSKGIKGPLKLLLRQPEDKEDQTAAEQQQQQDEELESPAADSAAATAAGDGDSRIDVDSVGEFAAGLEGGASGRGSSCSGVAGQVEEEGFGVRRLADSSASIRRYHMLRRAETGE